MFVQCHKKSGVNKICNKDFVGRPRSSLEQHHVFPSKCESYNKMAVLAAAVVGVAVKACEHSADPDV